MAYATQDQVLDYLQGGQQGQTAGVDPTASKSMGSSGGSGIVSTGAPSAAPQGTGGSQQWTNIQSYLTANQGQNQQRADGVKQQVQGTFGQEKQQFDQKAQEAKSSAEKATEPVRSINQDKASQLISQASSADKGSEGYQQAINPLKQAVSTKIEAPKTFAYGLGAQTQELGQVQDQQKFGNVLGMFDKKAQGGRDLSTGQRALQNQLDVQNPFLEQTRQDLATQYKGLTDDIGARSVDTNKQVSDIYSQGQKSQDELKSFLENQASGSMSNLENLSQANNAAVDKSETEYQQSINDLAAQRASVFDPNQQYQFNEQKGAAQYFSGLSDDQLRILDVSKISENSRAFMDQMGGSANSNYLNARGELKAGKAPNDYMALNYLNMGKGNKGIIDYINALRAQPQKPQGQRADIKTVAGGDADRSKYNVLMEIFGKQGV